MNYTPEDLLKYLYTAPKLREDALHALSHNDIDFSFIPVPPECLFLTRVGISKNAMRGWLRQVTEL